MKNTIKLIMILSALHLQGFAQTGIATYKTASTIRLPGDSSMSHTDQAMLQRKMREAMQREYTLTFDGHESNYKQVEKLDKEAQASAGGMRVMMPDDNGLTYKDTKGNRYMKEEDLFGKPFLIDDQLEKLEWKMTGEKKQIGRYECERATFMRESRSMEIDSQNGEPKETIREVEVSAWFTMDIPVNHGPDRFWGLPGLILEVNDGNFTIICSKVTINPAEEVEIKMPKNGKSITRQGFEELSEAKLQEMMQQYNGKNSGRRIMRVGG